MKDDVHPQEHDKSGRSFPRNEKLNMARILFQLRIGRLIELDPGTLLPPVDTQVYVDNKLTDDGIGRYYKVTAHEWKLVEDAEQQDYLEVTIKTEKMLED